MSKSSHTEAMNRREFLRTLACTTIALGATPLVADFLVSDAGAARRNPNRTVPDQAAPLDPELTRTEIWHYARLPEKRIKCFVCPLNCILNDGETCFCRTRTNYGGVLYNEAYQNPCILQVDPVEKGPFYHVKPATQTLAIGTAGCNLRCVFCQNWQISQKQPSETKNLYVPVGGTPEITREKDCRSITFTYTEPVIFYEYSYRVAECARELKIPSYVATAGFINERPLREWCKVIDAFSVSIKACDDESYKRLCGQPMQPVLDAVKIIREEGRWLELVYVVIPTVNDDIKDIGMVAKWIVGEVGVDVPLHLARFFPAYKLNNLPRTPVKQLEDARQAALEAGLRYVYLDNVPGHPAGNTRCHRCNELLVERVGFKTIRSIIDSHAQCPACHTTIPGLWG